jgi:Tfp pilus assembly protein PilW
MIVVLFALYNVFDMSIRVFSFGNDKLEAVENARLGLEKMERELRDAYPYNKAGGNATLFPSFTSNSITISFYPEATR